MASFFGFGAFSTPVGQLVERATDNAASAGNLPLHLEVCDVINETDAGPKDAVAAIRKRLTGSSKNFHIINLTLTVLETCVKNCGLRFHVKIAQREFLNDLLRVVQPKNNPPTIVKERVLGLIQYWADAFQGRPQLATVGEVYEELKAQGVEFPPVDLDQLAPVETPSRQGQAPSAPQDSLSLTSQPHPSGQSRGPPRDHRSRARGPIGPLKPEQVAKLLSELDIVRRNIDIMSEIMTENEPGKESPEDFQLLEELNRSVHSMQSRVADLIERVQDEVILESTLQINDELNSVFVRYERYLGNREALHQPPQQGTVTTEKPQTDTHTEGGVATTNLNEPASSISYPSLEEQPPAYDGGTTVGTLIDLGTDLSTPVPPQTTGGTDIVSQLADMGITGGQAPPTHTADPQIEQSADEFDMFAKSRTAYAGNTGGSTYDDLRVDQTQSLSQALHGRSSAEPNVYSDLQEWLAEPSSTTPTTQPGAESATSAEFDQFLQQRSQQAESLPPARHRPQMQRKDDQPDELFAL